MAIPEMLRQLGMKNIMQQAGQVKQMMQMVQSAKNPQLMLNMMAERNPQMKQVLDIVNQYGGDPMKALNEKAKELGVNPDEIMNMLR